MHAIRLPPWLSKKNPEHDVAVSLPLSLTASLLVFTLPRASTQLLKVHTMGSETLLLTNTALLGIAVLLLGLIYLRLGGPRK